MANWVKSFLDSHPDLAARPVSKRACHSLHFDLGDGRHQAHFTGKPIHYLNAQTGWQALDTALLSDGSGRYSAPGLPIRLGADGLIEILGQSWTQKTNRVGLYRPSTKAFIGVRSLNNLTPALNVDTLIRESGVWRHELKATEDGLREQLIIASLPNVGATQAGDYLVLETLVNSDSWADASELGTFTHSGMMFDLPRAWDAAGNEAPIKRLALRDGAQPRLLTGIPVSWLSAAQYPVVIDPDFSATTSSDLYITGANAVYATSRQTATAHSNNISNLVGQDIYGANYQTHRTLLKFVTSSIGAGSTITQVNLTMVCTNDSTNVNNFDAQIVKCDWSAWEPVTSANRDAAYDAILTDSSDLSIWRNTNGMALNTPYTSGNLDTTWVNATGSTYYGLRSSRDYDGTAYSSDEYISTGGLSHPTVTYRPVLTVTYEMGGAGAQANSKSRPSRFGFAVRIGV